LNIDSSHIQQTIQHYGRVLKAIDILRSIPSITYIKYHCSNQIFRNTFQSDLKI